MCMFSVAFLLYAALMIATTLVLIIHFVPHYGQTYVMVYIGVCSIVGSLSVCSRFFMRFFSFSFYTNLCKASEAVLTGYEC